MTCFFEFCAASLIAVESYDSETSSIANLIATICLLGFFFVSIPCLFKGMNSKRKVGKQTGKDLGANYGSSLLGFKPSYSKKRNSNLKFVGAFLAVRAAYLVIVFYIPLGWVQLCLTIFLVQWATSYMGYHLPMHGKFNNILMLFNMVAMMFCLYHMMTFSDWLEPEEQYMMGWSFLYTILIFITVNMLTAFLEFIRMMVFLAEDHFGFINQYVRPFLRWVEKKISQFLDWLQIFNCALQFRLYMAYLAKNRNRYKP